MTQAEPVEITYPDWWSIGESVFVVCPGCRTTLRLDHAVADDGTISPSLDCPIPGCAFHDFCRLVGWASREAAS